MCLEGDLFIWETLCTHSLLSWTGGSAAGKASSIDSSRQVIHHLEDSVVTSSSSAGQFNQVAMLFLDYHQHDRLLHP